MSDETKVLASRQRLARRLSRIDLSVVRRQVLLHRGPRLSFTGASNGPMEYLRFLLLRITHPEQAWTPSPLLQAFWLLHAAQGEKFRRDCELALTGTDSPVELLRPQSRPPRPSPVPAAAYLDLFPSGNEELWGWEAGPATVARASVTTPVQQHLPDLIAQPELDRLRKESAGARTTAVVSAHDRPPGAGGPGHRPAPSGGSRVGWPARRWDQRRIRPHAVHAYWAAPPAPPAPQPQRRGRHRARAVLRGLGVTRPS